MVQFLIHVEAEQRERLLAEAGRRGVSAASIVRECIDLVLCSGVGNCDVRTLNLRGIVASGTVLVIKG